MGVHSKWCRQCRKKGVWTAFRASSKYASICPACQALNKIALSKKYMKRKLEVLEHGEI